MNTSLKKIHETALKQFDTIIETVSDEREQCREDRRFYSIAGAQWEGAIGDQFENRPQFEINKIHLSIMRIITEYRNNRISVNFSPKNGQQDDNLSDTCEGLYRATEEISNANEAYDNAFEESAGGGFGAWRLTTELEDEEDVENEQQIIRIEPIYDADSTVYFDLQARRQDKADADHCFVITAISDTEYEEKYGSHPTKWDTDHLENINYDWCPPDEVHLAEYYKVSIVEEKLQVWEKLDGQEIFLTEDDLKDETFVYELQAEGAKLDRHKTIKRRVINKYILSGEKIVDDCGVIAGKNIPVVPTYGKRWVVDRIERCMGHVRLAKDAARLKNMQTSHLAEISAQSPIEKPIFTPEQIAGHESMWARDNLDNHPYLLVNNITNMDGTETPAGPLGHTKSPNIPQALSALLQYTEQDIKDLLGGLDNQDQLPGNISTETAHLFQNRSDVHSFIYLSNMAKAMRRSGEIWLSMAKDIYVERKRKLKTVDAQGGVGQIELFKPIVGENNKTMDDNDLANAKFDITVEVGPSTASKRQATVSALSGVASLTDEPDTKSVISSMIMLNLEGEGLSEMREYFRQKLVKLGALKPTDEEKKQLEAAAGQKDANTLYLESLAQTEQVKAGKMQADTELTRAKVDETVAKTMEVLQGVDVDRQNRIMELIQTLVPGTITPDQPETTVQIPEQ